MLLPHALMLVFALAQAANDGAPALQWISTEHLGRLTGSLQNPIAPVELAGTDLGVNVDRRVRWSVDEYRGQLVRLEILDESSAPWGFVTVRGFGLVR